MKIKKILFPLSILSFFLWISCDLYIPGPKKKVHGCIDPNSLKYNPQADIDDSSCTYRYINKFVIQSFPQKDTLNNNWDPASNPDLYMYYISGNSTAAQTSVKTEISQSMLPLTINFEFQPNFQNSNYTFELRDDDNGQSGADAEAGNYDLIGLWKLNPISSKYTKLTDSTGYFELSGNSLKVLVYFEDHKP